MGVTSPACSNITLCLPQASKLPYGVGTLPMLARLHPLALQSRISGDAVGEVPVGEVRDDQAGPHRQLGEGDEYAYGDHGDHPLDGVGRVAIWAHQARHRGKVVRGEEDHEWDDQAIHGPVGGLDRPKCEALSGIDMGVGRERSVVGGVAPHGAHPIVFGGGEHGIVGESVHLNFYSDA